MKYVVLTNDPEIAEAAQSPAAFPPDDVVNVHKSVDEALTDCDGADMLFVDLLATLSEPHKIAGYEDFAMKKMGSEIACGTPLVLIGAPDDYELDFMTGWPDFVFAHLRRPVTEKIFRRASTWI
ncbi:MAG TPA: hypothetical protein VGL56_20595 [Fimbriimonadaceae bacterium]|jgi:hypothetical protein